MLECKNISQRFQSNNALSEVSLTLNKGVYGLIGENGAGKSTLFKLLIGLMPLQKGSITIDGGPPEKNKLRMGYLPQNFDFFHKLTVYESLEYVGTLKGLSKNVLSEEIHDWLRRVNLLAEKEKKTGALSGGMKQRLGIAQALLTQPKLLICDEPTSALDPVGRKEILDILRKISSTTTVLFSTHILSDVERICDHAALLNQGGVVVEGTLSEIKALHGHESLLLEFPADDALHTFKSQEAIQPLLNTAEESGKEIVFHSQEMEKVQHRVLSVLAETALCPIKIEIMEPSLESLFLEVIR